MPCTQVHIAPRAPSRCGDSYSYSLHVGPDARSRSRGRTHARPRGGTQATETTAHARGCVTWPALVPTPRTPGSRHTHIQNSKTTGTPRESAQEQKSKQNETSRLGPSIGRSITALAAAAACPCCLIQNVAWPLRPSRRRQVIRPSRLHPYLASAPIPFRTITPPPLPR